MNRIALHLFIDDMRINIFYLTDRDTATSLHSEGKQKARFVFKWYGHFSFLLNWFKRRTLVTLTLSSCYISVYNRNGDVYFYYVV